MDFTFNQYTNLLQYTQISFRHDVDRKPEKSLKMAQLEHEYRVKATYYFRMKPESYNEKIIKEIIKLGHEIGNICKKMDIDSHKVMELFCMDTQLNISPYYFKPGFAYGGSCLPKDMKAMRTLAHDFYIKSPIIENIENSNENQKKIAIDMIDKTGKIKIGFIGLSFKPGTDDLRYSPAVDVAEHFYGKGYELNIWDKNVEASKLIGTNKEYIDVRMPHLHNLISNDIDYVVEKSEVIFITQKHEKLKDLIKNNPDKIFIDTIKVIGDNSFENYQGICW